MIVARHQPLVRMTSAAAAATPAAVTSASALVALIVVMVVVVEASHGMPKVSGFVSFIVVSFESVQITVVRTMMSSLPSTEELGIFILSEPFFSSEV